MNPHETNLPGPQREQRVEPTFSSESAPQAGEALIVVEEELTIGTVVVYRRVLQLPPTENVKRPLIKREEYSLEKDGKNPFLSIDVDRNEQGWVTAVSETLTLPPESRLLHGVPVHPEVVDYAPLLESIHKNYWAALVNQSLGNIPILNFSFGGKFSQMSPSSHSTVMEHPLRWTFPNQEARVTALSYEFFHVGAALSPEALTSLTVALKEWSGGVISEVSSVALAMTNAEYMSRDSAEEKSTEVIYLYAQVKINEREFWFVYCYDRKKSSKLQGWLKNLRAKMVHDQIYSAMTNPLPGGLPD